MPALRFKTCRLLSGNVWNRELTIIQRRILRKLRNKKRSIKRNIYSRENLNSYIQSQTTRKLPLFHGDLPITEMHRGRERTSYIPFLLNPETRSDVIPVRLHFRETIPQARQPINHRKVCVNNGMVSITHFKVSRGDIISFQENDARARGEEIRRSFYIEISVEKIKIIVEKIKIIGKFRDRPVRMWRRTKTEWFRLLKTKRGCRLLLKKDLFLLLKEDLLQQLHSSMQEEDLERTKLKEDLCLFLQQLHSSMQEEDLERTKKFGSIKVCLGSYFAEHNRMKRNLYHLKPLNRKRRNEKNRNLPTRTRSPIVYNPFLFLYSNDSYDYYDYDSDGNPYDSPLYDSSTNDINSTYCSAPPHRFTMKRKRKRIELPTHYSEVNHRTLKAVVSYGPNIGHIPHDIRLKDPNLLLRSGNGRGQNI